MYKNQSIISFHQIEDGEPITVKNCIITVNPPQLAERVLWTWGIILFLFGVAVGLVLV